MFWKTGNHSWYVRNFAGFMHEIDFMLLTVVYQASERRGQKRGEVEVRMNFSFSFSAPQLFYPARERKKNSFQTQI